MHGPSGYHWTAVGADASGSSSSRQREEDEDMAGLFKNAYETRSPEIGRDLLGQFVVYTA